MKLEAAGQEPTLLRVGDAFGVPPKMATRYAGLSDDLALLDVSLPGLFTTLPDVEERDI